MALGEHLIDLVNQLPAALKSADQEARARAAGQNDMFGLASAARTDVAVETVELAEWSQRELLLNEKEALGLYLTGHPFDSVRGDAQHLWRWAGRRGRR